MLPFMHMHIMRHHHIEIFLKKQYFNLLVEGEVASKWKMTNSDYINGWGGTPAAKSG